MNEGLRLEFYSIKRGAEKGDCISGQCQETVLHLLPDRHQQRKGDGGIKLEKGEISRPHLSVSVHLMSGSGPGIHFHE